MANYYCLMAGLPDIKLEDTALDVSIEELREELDINATEADKKILFYFFLKNDCANVAKLLKNGRSRHASVSRHFGLTTTNSLNET